MMIGEFARPHPTVQISNWEPYDADPTDPLTFPSPNSRYFTMPSAEYSSTAASADYSPSSAAADYAAALHLYLPPSSAGDPAAADSDTESSPADIAAQYDSFSCDEFRMYEFKVRRCMRGRSHDWTECPFAHAGEKARRRDLRRFHYSGTACPDFRKGSCKKGDACEFAHGVFECWLHPSRYRTQPCKDGIHCTRRVCFFAHSPNQLRVLPATADSPPEMLSPPSESPPMSPRRSYGKGVGGVDSLSELVGAMKGLQMGGCGGGSKVMSPRCWGFKLGCSPRSAFGSPRAVSGPGSVHSTPSRAAPVVSGLGGFFDTWDLSFQEDLVMERVESGRDIRERMYAKLRRENALDRAESPCPVPDFGWVSELVK